MKTLSATAVSGPEPWNPAPNLFNGFTIPSNVLPRMPFEIDLLGGMDRFRICQRFSTASLGTKDDSFERLVDGKSRIGPRESFVNGNAGDFFHRIVNKLEAACAALSSGIFFTPKYDFSVLLQEPAVRNNQIHP